MKKDNKKFPKISIVMSVYSEEEILKECIESILNQTFKDFEFIIINDASERKARQIVKSYMKKDKRIILINNKTNLGLRKSLNKGLKLAKGKYIARMDADDIALPERFEIQSKYLEIHPDIFLVGSSAIIINQQGEEWGVFRKYNSPKKTARKLLRVNTMIHPSIMFRNKGDLFYREKFVRSEDYDFYLRLLTEGKKITNISRPLIKYRISDGKGKFKNKKPHQEFYLQKTKEFYWQRKKFGKDDYGNMEPTSKKSPPINFPKMNLQVKILAEFQVGKMKQTRRDIKKYFKKYGKNKTMIKLYSLSFLPKNIIKFLMKNY